MPKKPDVLVYSLISVSTGNTLSAAINSYGYFVNNETTKKKRTYKISQFQPNRDVLEYLISDREIVKKWRYAITQIWVEESDIDSLYGFLSICVLISFCQPHKVEALFLAFLLHVDPQLFLDFNGTSVQRLTFLRDKKLGIVFLKWLEAQNILSFITTNNSRTLFSHSEFELISKPKKEVGSFIFGDS